MRLWALLICLGQVFLCSQVRAGTEFSIFLPGFESDKELKGAIFSSSSDGYDSSDHEFAGSSDPYLAFVKRYGEDGWDHQDLLLAVDHRHSSTPFPKIWRVKIWGESCADWPMDILAWWRTDDPLLEISGTVCFGDQALSLSLETELLELPPNADGYDIIVEIAKVPEPSSSLVVAAPFPCFLLKRRHGIGSGSRGRGYPRP